MQVKVRTLILSKEALRELSEAKMNGILAIHIARLLNRVQMLFENEIAPDIKAAQEAAASKGMSKEEIQEMLEKILDEEIYIDDRLLLSVEDIEKIDEVSPSAVAVLSWAIQGFDQ